MQQKEKPMMVVTCQKCGNVRKSDLEFEDEGSCPNCGKHGKITLSNSRTIALKGGGHAFVPAN